MQVVRLGVYNAIVLAAAGALPAAGTNGESLEQFFDVRSLTQSRISFFVKHLFLL